MIAAAALPLAFGGLASLCLSMERHARQTAFRRPAPPLRIGGWLLLGLSLAAVPLAANWRFALIEWIGLASAGAGLVVMMLFYRPSLLAPAAATASAAGLALTGLTIARFVAS